MKFASVVMAGCAALALAACKKDLSEITDEQLAALLGDDNEPAQITTRTRECAEVLGGINEAVYQDVPEDMLGMVKTDCRKRFQGWLDDPARNGTELTLEDFERAELAERIVALDKAQEALREERRAAEWAEKMEAAGAELDQVTDAGRELRAGLEERRAVLAPACETLRGLREELQARDRTHSLFSRGLPFACSGEPLRREMERVEALEERISRFEQRIAEADPQKPSGLMFASMPTLPRVDLDDVDAQIEQVEAATVEYRAALAED